MGTPDIQTSGLMLDLKTVQVQSQIRPSRFSWVPEMPTHIYMSLATYRYTQRIIKTNNTINRLKRKYEK